MRQCRSFVLVQWGHQLLFGRFHCYSGQCAISASTSNQLMKTANPLTLAPADNAIPETSLDLYLFCRRLVCSAPKCRGKVLKRAAVFVL